MITDEYRDYTLGNCIGYLTTTSYIETLNFNHESMAFDYICEDGICVAVIKNDERVIHLTRDGLEKYENQLSAMYKWCENV